MRIRHAYISSVGSNRADSSRRERAAVPSPPVKGQRVPWTISEASESIAALDRRDGKGGDRTRPSWFALGALTILLVWTAASAPIDTATVAAAPSFAARNAAASKQGTNLSSWGATPSDPCDPLDPSGCMLPFPNDYYTVPSTAMPTGGQIYFPPGAFPTAVGSAPVNVTPWERNDGFSPGSTLLLHVPGISLSMSHVATISRIGHSLDGNSPIVLLDTSTDKRWPTWAELDSDDTDRGTQLLIIHPARNLSEGHRYIVALRNLKTASGRSIGPSPTFGSSVLGIRYHYSSTFEPLAPGYAAHLKNDLTTLAQAGVSRRGLYVTWDFTVASRQNLTSPELDMRNEVFQQLGSSIPKYTVTKVVDDPKSNLSLAREVSGTFDVASFLTERAGQPGPSSRRVREAYRRRVGSSRWQPSTARSHGARPPNTLGTSDSTDTASLIPLPRSTRAPFRNSPTPTTTCSVAQTGMASRATRWRSPPRSSRTSGDSRALPRVLCSRSSMRRCSAS